MDKGLEQGLDQLLQNSLQYNQAEISVYPDWLGLVNQDYMACG